MSEKSELPATPKQAGEIFTQLAELTTLQGKHYSHCAAFGEAAVSVPNAIAEHFPAVEDDSLSAARTIYATQEFDHETGQPRTKGVVGNVAFKQAERRDAELIYATQVNYHIVSDDGVNRRLERHVTSNEFGRAAVARSAVRMAMSPVDRLAELIALRDKVEETRGTEADLGLSAVTADEADEIAKTLSSLLGANLGLDTTGISPAIELHKLLPEDKEWGRGITLSTSHNYPDDSTVEG